MKKIVLLALVAVTAFACKNKVAPVDETIVPVVTDSIVMVDSLGTLVQEVFVNEMAATENVPAQSNKMTLHHQQLAKEGVFEYATTTKKEDGTDEVSTKLGRWTLTVVEGGEFPIYELTAFGEGSTTEFWALDGVVLRLLDANKMPLETPFILALDVAASTAPVAEPVETVAEEVAPEAAPAN